VRARHLLRTWILHLTNCWLGPGTTTSGTARTTYGSESTLIGRTLVGPGAVRHQFAPVRDPAQHLERLVLRYQEGLVEPLRLFPSTSHALAAWQRKPNKKDDELPGLLEKEWQGELGTDAHLERVYGTRRPFSELRRNGAGTGFDALALEVFEPLLEHLTSVEHES
jgi:exonuclease V gamma subunit